MAKCEHCGNEYDKTFEVRFGGKTHVFDSFECAIQKMAPGCSHCGCHRHSWCHLKTQSREKNLG